MTSGFRVKILSFKNTLALLVFVTIVGVLGFDIYSTYDMFMIATLIPRTWEAKTTTTTTATTAAATVTSNNLRKRSTSITTPICGNASDLIDVDAITPLGRAKVQLFINIPTAGYLFNRRTILRNNWLSTAKNYSVAYRFFTDEIGIEQERMDKLKNERALYKDLEFIPTKKGYWLAHRYLFSMFWAYEHYDFMFYMKTDDDYFVCLNNLMNDLQYRRQEKLLYWGWLRCKSVVFIDEGFLIITSDLVREFIKRNNSLCCSPFGDQMITFLMNRLEHEGYNVTYFPDNTRLMHYRKFLKKEHSDMCKEIIGIHQAYPKHMVRYWNITIQNWYSIQRDEFVKVKIKKYTDYCSQTRQMNWRAFSSFWKQEPKPCWLPGLNWPELQKYKEVQSRELDEHHDVTQPPNL